MSCKYYYFKSNDFYCLKQEKYVDTDTYYKYCRDYNYDECPIYKSSSGGCYISTACMCAIGTDEDCDELNMLRDFRDNYMKQRAGGAKEVMEYYKYAPLIVDKINKNENSCEIYKEIFQTYISKCIDAIKDNIPEQAYEIYKKMFCQLKSQYL